MHITIITSKFVLLARSAKYIIDTQNSVYLLKSLIKRRLAGVDMLS